MTMLTLAADMYSLSMCAIHVAGAGVRTSLGQIVYAGERIDEPPRVPAPFRTMEGWVLTYVTEGSGAYHHVDGRKSPIRPGAVILVPPSVPHWYGTPTGGRGPRRSPCSRGRCSPCAGQEVATGRTTPPGAKPTAARTARRRPGQRVQAGHRRAAVAQPGGLASLHPATRRIRTSLDARRPGRPAARCGHRGRSRHA